MSSFRLSGCRLRPALPALPVEDTRATRGNGNTPRSAVRELRLIALPRGKRQRPTLGRFVDHAPIRQCLLDLFQHGRRFRKPARLQLRIDELTVDADLEGSAGAWVQREGIDPRVVVVKDPFRQTGGDADVASGDAVGDVDLCFFSHVCLFQFPPIPRDECHWQTNSGHLEPLRNRPFSIVTSSSAMRRIEPAWRTIIGSTLTIKPP